MASLKGQIAFVTGASRGIGRAIALRLAAGEADLALVARSERELAALAAEIKVMGREALPIVADLRVPSSIQAATDRALRFFGRVDILVNNAGLWHYAPLQELTLEQWDEMFDVNLRGTFLCTRALLPSMRQRKKGHIVNIGSVSAIEPEEEGAGYCATKYGLRGLTEVLRREVAGAGIRVHLVNPGLVNNENHKGAEWQREIQPEDVAELIWLAVTLPVRVNASEITLRTGHASGE